MTKKTNALLKMKPGDAVKMDGYWCVFCGGFLPAINGVIRHEHVPHPVEILYFEDEETMH